MMPLSWNQEGRFFSHFKGTFYLEPINQLLLLIKSRHILLLFIDVRRERKGGREQILTGFLRLPKPLHNHCLIHAPVSGRRDRLCHFTGELRSCISPDYKVEVGCSCFPIFKNSHYFFWQLLWYPRFLGKCGQARGVCSWYHNGVRMGLGPTPHHSDVIPEIPLLGGSDQTFIAWKCLSQNGNKSKPWVHFYQFLCFPY